MPTIAYADKRKHPRYPVDGLFVSVRRKGRLSKLTGMAVDFNRYGLAIVTDQPLPKDATVYLNIVSTDTKIDNIVGVVHNCIGQETGYRCGIQFRTTSPLQDDQCEIESSLILLEEYHSRLVLPA